MAVYGGGALNGSRLLPGLAFSDREHAVYAGQLNGMMGSAHGPLIGDLDIVQIGQPVQIPSDGADRAAGCDSDLGHGLLALAAVSWRQAK